MSLPLTDGLLKLRWLFGFVGDALIAGAIDSEKCERCTATEILDYLLSVSDYFDIDDDGEFGALTDGLLNLRWLFGFRGDALISGAVDTENCKRCTAAEIDEYLESLD
jgi:hypothetical protein